jgi:membrane-associated phospholipid phosphatase
MLLHGFFQNTTTCGRPAAGRSRTVPHTKKGTIKNSSVLSANIAYVASVTASRTDEQAVNAYYDDSGNDYGSITNSSALYDVIHLIQDVRSNGASSNPAKYYFNYPRPWRLANGSTMTENAAKDAGGYYADRGYYASDRTSEESYPAYSSDVSVVPALKPARGTNPAADGGFPSGHTAESDNTGLIMAYAVPERYQELLTRASELGNNRILAGMHSPLDVMGGRILVTAITAAGLYNSHIPQIKMMLFQQRIHI